MKANILSGETSRLTCTYRQAFKVKLKFSYFKRELIWGWHVQRQINTAFTRIRTLIFRKECCIDFRNYSFIIYTLRPKRKQIRSVTLLHTSIVGEAGFCSLSSVFDRSTPSAIIRACSLLTLMLAVILNYCIVISWVRSIKSLEISTKDHLFRATTSCMTTLNFLFERLHVTSSFYTG